MEKVKRYIDEHRERFVEELFSLLRIPSISADSAHRGDMVRCAEHLRDALLSAGADRAEVMPTDGNPIVYGEKIVDSAAPTVLVYGHYDVIPVDPSTSGRPIRSSRFCATDVSGGAGPTTTRDSRSCTSKRWRR